MLCDTICGYCRKGVKSAHGIEAVYMCFNGSGIWGGETTYLHATITSIHSVHSQSETANRLSVFDRRRRDMCVFRRHVNSADGCELFGILGST